MVCGMQAGLRIFTLTTFLKPIIGECCDGHNSYRNESTPNFNGKLNVKYQYHFLLNLLRISNRLIRQMT